MIFIHILLGIITHTNPTNYLCYYNHYEPKNKPHCSKFLPGPPSIDNDAHGIKKLLLLCYINIFTSLFKNLSNLLEFLAEDFRCHVHHFQCLTVPVELAAMFRFIVVGIAEMLLWLLYLIVSKSVWDL